MFDSIVLPDHIQYHRADLTPTVSLYVYLINGGQSAAWIDTGYKSLHTDLRRLMRRYQVPHTSVEYLLHTHSHHDHIGGTAQMADFTGAKVVAPAACAHWHSDWEAHYQEFARSVPALIPDTPELKKEVLGLLDLPHHVDLICEEGDVFDLGAGVEMECVMFQGHMPAEAGWLDRSSDTLLLGDVVTLMDAPFMHGHVDVSGYQESLEKLDGFVLERGVEWVCMAHYAPMDVAQLLDLTQRARNYILDIRKIVWEQTQMLPTSLEQIWKGTCAALHKQVDFRSLRTILAHLEALVKEGHLKEVEAGHSYQLV